MEKHLRLGTAKVDITPPIPIPLAGFAYRTGNFEAIQRRLYARFWFFEQEGGEHKRRALVVQADLIWWGAESMQRFRHLLFEKWGFEPSSVILHASHTHSGPQTSNLFAPSVGKPDPDYLEMLESKLLEGISEAKNNLEFVHVYKGIGESRIGVHRRKEINGKIMMAPNRDGPLDSEVNVIRFQTCTGETKGVFFHYTCHPTVSGDNFISSEFSGVAMETVEQSLGGGAVVSFLQGCCGDIRPALIRDDAFYRGNEDDIDRLGKSLSDEVLRVLDGPMKLLPSGQLTWRNYNVMLPFQQLPGLDYLISQQHEEGIAGEWSTLLLNDPSRICDSIPLEISLLQISENLSFLALNGEVVVDYGLFVKSQFGGKVLPLAYSNGMIGYVPTAKQIREGGYEGKDSALYFGLPAPFDPSLEKLICDGIIHLIEEE